MDDPLHDAPLGAIETAPDGKITADNERVGPLTEHEADRRADRLNRRLDRVQQIDSLIVTVLQRIIHHGTARLRKSLTPLISLARRCCTTSAGPSESSSMRFCQRPLKRGRGRMSSTICRSPRKHRAD